LASAPDCRPYAGGPAYPLSSLGVRLRGEPIDSITMLTGVFQDNPPGGPFNNDSQLLGPTRYGANFNLRTGALFIAELQYALKPASAG
jgi:porin